MKSCEEATWFLKNCPGVEMDGNHDGVPCEMQWCTGRRARRRADNAPRCEFSREETMTEQRTGPPRAAAPVAMVACHRRR